MPQRGEAFCNNYCGCMEDAIAQEDAFDAFFAGTRTPDDDARLQEMVAACSLDADLSQPAEESP